MEDSHWNTGSPFAVSLQTSCYRLALDVRFGALLFMILLDRAREILTNTYPPVRELNASLGVDPGYLGQCRLMVKSPHTRFPQPAS